SFATALVSAAVWLLVRARPSWTPGQIRAVLEQCVTSKPTTPEGRDCAVGHGRLDLRVMMQQLALNP
ncbi:MAG TPA: S8 family serine peptidase, partial [Gemmatimonadaceae bacterium]|nr:S8 family serine peptidase [Gemmatimonadaceae bacterium]